MTTFDPQGRTGFGLHVFVLRFYRLGLTQAQFAERFGISLGCVRDIEQNRTRSAAMGVLLEAIALDPALVERAAALWNRRTKVPELEDWFEVK